MEQQRLALDFKLEAERLIERRLISVTRTEFRTQLRLLGKNFAGEPPQTYPSKQQTTSEQLGIMRRGRDVIKRVEERDAPRKNFGLFLERIEVTSLSSTRRSFRRDA